MSTFTLPNIISNSTPADGSELAENFTAIATFLNTQVVRRDGAIPMDSPLRVPTATADNEAVNLGMLAGIVPTGSILPYAGPTAPTTWVFCQGQAASTTDPDYVDLFAVIGYQFGGADGTFYIPNLQGRVPVGRDAADTNFDEVGLTGGTADQATLAHTHPIPSHTHPFSGTSVANNVSHVHSNAHDHAQFNSGGQSADHNHGPNSAGQGFVITGEGGDPDYIDVGINTGSGPHFSKRDATNTTSNDHTHPVNVPAYTGNTGNNNVTHTHTYSGTTSANTAALATSSTGTGDGTDANLQPFLTLNYIIKLRM